MERRGIKDKVQYKLQYLFYVISSLPTSCDSAIVFKCSSFYSFGFVQDHNYDACNFMKFLRDLLSPRPPVLTKIQYYTHHHHVKNKKKFQVFLRSRYPNNGP